MQFFLIDFLKRERAFCYQIKKFTVLSIVDCSIKHKIMHDEINVNFESKKGFFE